MIKRSIIYGFLSIALYAHISWTDNFIFDIDGILLRTDSLNALKQIGLQNLLSVMITQKKSSSAIQCYIEKKFFDILDKAADCHGFSNNTEKQSYYINGKTLPFFISAWLHGDIAADEIRKLVLFFITNNPELFSSKKEQHLISNLVRMVFVPKNFVSSRKINKRAIAFVKMLKKEGHKLYILSNWDAESFELLRQRYKSFFDLFDGFLVSGSIHSVKPRETIYQTLIADYMLIAKDSWFIDDQADNIEAACNLAINGILCEHKNGSKKPDLYNLSQKIPCCCHMVRERKKFPRNISGLAKAMKN